MPGLPGLNLKLDDKIDFRVINVAPFVRHE